MTLPLNSSTRTKIKSQIGGTKNSVYGNKNISWGNDLTFHVVEPKVTCTCIWAISLSFHFFVTLNTLPPSPRWQAKITQASAKLHAHREKVPYVIFSARENGWGLSFLRTLYSPYSVDRARMIATHQPAILNKYVWTLKDQTVSNSKSEDIVAVYFTFIQGCPSQAHNKHELYLQ